jgi:hypothetical protein
LIHLQRVDRPVCLGESLGIVLYPFLACGCLLAAGTSVPNTAAASPLSTERSVEYNLLLLECVFNVAGTGELGSWFAPAAGIRAVTENIGRNRVAWEEVNADGFGGPLSRIYTPADLVQACTVALGRRMFDGASRILGLVLGIDIAVSCSHRTRKLGGIFTNLAAWTCVKGHAIVRLVVHAFEDVDFAVFWPVGTGGPESVEM